MSIWVDAHKKNIGIEIRKEDIKNCWFEVEIKSCEKFGYYDEKKLSREQVNSLRWHNVRINFKQEGVKGWRYWRIGIITRLGETGKDKIESYVKKVCDKYKNNIGELVLDENGRCKEVSDKTREVVVEIFELVNEENNRVLIEEV